MLEFMPLNKGNSLSIQSLSTLKREGKMEMILFNLSPVIGHITGANQFLYISYR